MYVCGVACVCGVAYMFVFVGPKRMHSAKILAETEMNQHSGKILATIAFQIPVHLQTQTHMQHHKHMQHHEHT